PPSGAQRRPPCKAGDTTDTFAKLAAIACRRTPFGGPLGRHFPLLGGSWYPTYSPSSRGRWRCEATTEGVLSRDEGAQTREYKRCGSLLPVAMQQPVDECIERLPGVALWLGGVEVFQRLVGVAPGERLGVVARAHRVQQADGLLDLRLIERRGRGIQVAQFRAALQPVQHRQRLLALADVDGRLFARQRRVPPDVENVVKHLEGHAEAVAKGGVMRLHRLVRPCSERTEPGGGAEQGGGLAADHFQVLVNGDVGAVLK